MIKKYLKIISVRSAALAVPGQPNNKFLISRHSPLIFANIIPDFLAMIVTKIMLRLHWIFQRFLAGIVAMIVTKKNRRHLGQNLIKGLAPNSVKPWSQCSPKCFRNSVHFYVKMTSILTWKLAAGLVYVKTVQIMDENVVLPSLSSFYTWA